MGFTMIQQQSLYFVMKCLISGVLVGIISEIGRRNTLLGALLASLPLTSILALVWLYRETHNIEKVVSLSNSIALIVLPSLVFFVLLSSLLSKANLSFYVSLGLSCAGMVLTYSGYLWLLSKFKIQV